MADFTAVAAAAVGQRLLMMNISGFKWILETGLRLPEFRLRDGWDTQSGWRRIESLTATMDYFMLTTKKAQKLRYLLHVRLYQQERY